MIHKPFILISFIYSTFFLAPFCIAQGKHEPVRVGAIVPLSGDFAAYGALVRKGIGEVDAKGIQLIFEDDACIAKNTVSAFNKLVNVNKVNFILGPSCGSPQRVIAPHLKRKDILAVLTSSASEDLFKLSGGNIFGAQYSIEQESIFNAEVFTTKGLKRTAIIYFDNEFSRAHERAFSANFAGEVVRVFRFSTMNSDSMLAIATKIKQLSVDSLYIPDVTPLLFGLLTDLHKLDVEDLYVHSIYSAQMQDVIEAEGKHAEGLVYSYPSISDADAIAYFPRRAAQMLFGAIRQCGNNPKCVRATLKAGNNFDNRQMMKSVMRLKTIKGGRFQNM